MFTKKNNEREKKKIINIVLSSYHDQAMNLAYMNLKNQNPSQDHLNLIDLQVHNYIGV